ncbi:hypothetical protein DOZ80_10195 [Pseudomonas fluorescens]|uniref:Uncharacterized protein n=1 Tax=Pseudomonas fluorescens TaxID=294 RepID=A0A327N7X5_PSEFL|nr:hypothetical protein [Pseudomonas fluorescens]RAI70833.1 hypothetical protein DOZ80_10195 [Pseudomonas fluorescens]
MTIIKNASTVLYHPLTAIDPEVGDLILQAGEVYRQSTKARSFTIRPALQVLEAYCDITGQRITMETLRGPAIEIVLEGYVAALAGDELLDLPSKESVKFCRRIYQVLATARLTHPDLHAVSWDFALFKPDAAVCAKVASAGDFKRWYWGGWTIFREGGGSSHLRLAPLVAAYGRAFVEGMYVQLEKHYRGRGGDYRLEWGFMFDYLHKHQAQWPLRTFESEQGVKRFMHAFTLAHFYKAKKDGHDSKYKIKAWNKFLNAVESCLCKTGVWASLTSPIRRPPPATKHGSETRLREDEGGLLIQEKLITSIPLHVTDAEAIDVLFFHIKNDLATVRNWATKQAADLKSRFTRRISLAKEGIPIIEYTGRGMVKRYTQADICATLEDITSTVPHNFLCKVHEQITGEGCSAMHLASTYGFQMKGCLYPFQCLLVLEHPEITADFLNGFELYNQAGQLSGFNEEKRLLVGYKDRKQSDVREQTIKLNDTSFAIVKDIIEITSLGRRKLKAQGNDVWRQLFVNSARGTTVFGADVIPQWNKSSFANNSGLREQLIAQFTPHIDLPETQLVDFIQRVRLGRIRASAAVSVFIASKSTEEMSKALGHEHYYPDLLSHYLPEALLAFIKARWIRIFQKAMVCEAMKDSPHLLRVTKFNNMDELDTFLDNHRIKEIPPEASDPERKEQLKPIETSEAVLSIGVPFLSSLLSLEAAVTAASNRARVCGKAEYWASFAGKIKTEISSGYNRVLKKHLDAALKLVDAKKMEALIYVPAHWS